MVIKEFQDDVKSLLIQEYDLTEDEADYAIEDSLTSLQEIWEDEDLDPSDVAEIIAESL